MRTLNNKQEQQFWKAPKGRGLRIAFEQTEINVLFDQLIHRPWGYVCWRPAVDVYQDADTYTIVMDLPGATQEAVKVHISENKIIIEGERPPLPPAEGCTPCCCERPHGSFLRSIDVSEPLLENEVHVHYQQGVLTVIVKKKKQDAP